MAREVHIDELDPGVFAVSTVVDGRVIHIGGTVSGIEDSRVYANDRAERLKCTVVDHSVPSKPVAVEPKKE